jgi:hypothetical protein
MMFAQNQNAENSYRIGAELTNEVFILTKTPFASCLHRPMINFEITCREQQEQGNSENTL